MRNARAAEQGSRKYFFAIQQGRRTKIDPDHEDHISARSGRIKGSIENCLDPDRGQDPWQDSFSLWTKWPTGGGNTDPTLREITNSEQLVYLGKVKDALT